MVRSIIAMVLAGALASCTAAAPSRLAAADEHISDFNANDEQVNIRLQFSMAPASSSFAGQLEDAFDNIARVIATKPADLPITARFVSFDVRTGNAEFPDRFGNYRFEISDFAGSGGKPRDGVSVLNAVRDAETGSGDLVPQFVRWCAARSTDAVRLSRFCDRVAGSWALRG